MRMNDFFIDYWIWRMNDIKQFKPDRTIHDFPHGHASGR